MVIVLQVHRRTTSLAPFEKVLLHQLQLQVFSPLWKRNKSIPLYKKKGTLIDIFPMPAFLISARLVSKEFPLWIQADVE